MLFILYLAGCAAFGALLGWYLGLFIGNAIMHVQDAKQPLYAVGLA